MDPDRVRPSFSWLLVVSKDGLGSQERLQIQMQAVLFASFVSLTSLLTSLPLGFLICKMGCSLMGGMNGDAWQVSASSSQGFPSGP
jgi:hypothetical protein